MSAAAAGEGEAEVSLLPGCASGPPNIHLRTNIHCALLGGNLERNTNVMKYELCP